jgi:GYF domain 2
MAEDHWYYLHESRQVGPCTGSELHALRVRGVISSSTLVWSRNTDGWRALQSLSDEPIEHVPESRLKWVVLALALVTSGITLVALELTSDSPRVGDEQELSAGIETQSQNKAIGANKPPQLIQKVSNTPTDTRLMPSPAGGFTSSQVVTSTRAALSGEARLEMEFWRSIIDSNDADLYEIYLYRYPGGTFTDNATAKIKQLGLDTKAIPVNQDNSGTSLVSKKVLKPADPSRVGKTTSPTAGNCRNGNIQQCRERCRGGELRACQILSNRNGKFTAVALASKNTYAFIATVSYGKSAYE